MNEYTPLRYHKWRCRYSINNTTRWLTITVPDGFKISAEIEGKRKAPRGWVLHEVRPVRSSQFTLD